MKSRFTKFALVAFAAAALTCSANALVISDPGVVGTVQYGIPSDPIDEAGYINHLLSLGANVTGNSFGGNTYNTSPTDYNGTVSVNLLTGSGTQDVFATTGNLVVPSGWDYVIAKYDGTQAGSVVWYLGGASMTLPSDSSSIWLNSGGQGFGISHFTVFKADPSGGDSVPEGGSTVVILGGALMIIGGVARRGFGIVAA
jgi:hypothetical protein